VFRPKPPANCAEKLRQYVEQGLGFPCDSAMIRPITDSSTRPRIAEPSNVRASVGDSPSNRKRHY
jgi:hypothetical protein